MRNSVEGIFNAGNDDVEECVCVCVSGSSLSDSETANPDPFNVP